MALIDDIAAHMGNSGLGTVSQDIFKSYLPDNGDACLAVIDTGGPKPDIYVPSKSPTFQVYIRAATYTAGKTKLAAVRALLHQTQNRTIGSTYFYYIHAIAEGGHVGRNERGLDEFSINFICKTR